METNNEESILKLLKARIENRKQLLADVIKDYNEKYYLGKIRELDWVLESIEEMEIQNG